MWSGIIICKAMEVFIKKKKKDCKFFCDLYVVVICSALSTVAFVHETVKPVLEESVKDHCVVCNLCFQSLYSFEYAGTIRLHKP
jgi:hypothetical protein